MQRRRVLAASVVLLISTAAFADAPPKPEPRPIAPGVWLIPGSFLPHRQPDGNTVIFAAPRGLIVMDTGRHKWQRQAILDFAKARGQPIVAIVNSHWHLDHVSGNPDIRAAYPGLKVYASDAIYGALKGFLPKSAADAKPYLQDKTLPAETLEDLRGDMATIGNGKALLPDVVIDKSDTRKIGGKSLAVNLARNAATDGDVWLYDAATRVAAAGDLITFPTPFLDTACPTGWSKALATIDRTAFTTVVPGHGSPMNHAQFGTYRKAFDGFIACSASARGAKECGLDWANAVQTLPGASSAKGMQGMAAYYVADVLRAHGGKSAYCKV
jgi:glyoxylase-like metal-dependent hydrolase (beta-lactamase superfamily II)